MTPRRSALAALSVCAAVGSVVPLTRADRVFGAVPRTGALDPRFRSFVNDRVAPVFDAPDGASMVRGHLARHQGYAVRSSANGPGCGRLWLEISDGRWVCGEFGVMSTAPPRALDQLVAATPEGLPWTYAFSARDGVPVWSSAREARAAGGVPRGRWEANWGFAVRAEYGERDARVFESVEGFFLRREDVYRAELSRFAGASLAGVIPSVGLRVGWVVEAGALSYATLDDARRERASVGRIARLTPVRVGREANAGRWDWAEVDGGRWVRRDKIRVVALGGLAAGVGPNDRWVDVDRVEQTLVAYEGPRAVYATVVSTGRAGNETPLGNGRVWARYLSRTMDNTENNGISGHFRMGDVPWVQFFDGDRGLHGVYWHDDFGHPRSHGCVNLSPRDAEWLFRWATPTIPTGWQSVFVPRSEAMRVRVR